MPKSALRYARLAGKREFRPPSRARGYDRTWEKLGRYYRALHPLCEMCEAEGMTRAVEIVDHIIPIRVRPDLRLEMTNLQSLCRSHHAVKTAQDEARYA